MDVIIGILLLAGLIMAARSFGWGSGFKNKKPLASKYKSPIEKYMSFYRALPPVSKVIFENKVRDIIQMKEFIPRQIKAVTSEMKALIAGSAVQLTFGLPDIFLEHFDKILVYPEEYYSIPGKNYHKGEVNPGLGIIVVSWKNFVEGYMNDDDGRNLGLHEMAHALQLENTIRNSEYYFFDHEECEKWELLAKEEINAIRKGKVSIFRDYGAIDLQEFFSVAVEVLFEQAVMFKKEEAAMYKTLCNLLRQDPVRLTNSLV